MLIYNVFEQNNVRSKVFVECIFYLGEFKEACSSFQWTPLPFVAPLDTKKLERGCIESFQHFNTLGSQIPRHSSGINFIVYINLVSPSTISYTLFSSPLLG
jgi:hypothetical protein